jgi:LysM repeat protein
VVSTTLPANVKVEGNVVSAPEMKGELPIQNTQHYFDLVPDQKDGEVTLTLGYDPQDSSELARRLNFWVLDPAGFNRYTDATSDVVLSEIAIAAGSSAPGLLPHQRQAKFTASGFGPYTVIVYNNSTVPATYDLAAVGATLSDDAKQSTTAQQALGGGSTAPAATDTGTAETPAAGSTTAPAATTEASTGPTREGEPGGTYVVKAGDTISLIARDIYGDVDLWDELCAFNNLSSCDAIEVGQELKLPTREQIGAGITPAATTAAATATSTPTPAGAAAAAAAASGTTTATKTATPTASATPAASETLTETETLTDTGTTTATGATTSTTGSTGSTSASTSGTNLIATLKAQGTFCMFVVAFEDD